MILLMCLYTTNSSDSTDISLPASELIIFDRYNDRLSFLNLPLAYSSSMTHRSKGFSYPLRKISVTITIRLRSHMGRELPGWRTLSLRSRGGDVLLGRPLTTKHGESTRVDSRGSSSWSRGLRRGRRGSSPVVCDLGGGGGRRSSPTIFLSPGRCSFISSPS